MSDGAAVINTEEEARRALKEAGATFGLNSAGDVVKISFSGPKFNDSTMELLNWLKRVKDVNLSGSKLTDAGLADIAKLRNLRKLTLSGTAVTDAGVANVRGCAKIEILVLSKTRVSGAALKPRDWPIWLP